MSCQIERAKRLTIMVLTMRDGYKLTARGVQEAFDVGPRTAHRDLIALGDIIPVMCSRKGNAYIWEMLRKEEL